MGNAVNLRIQFMALSNEWLLKTLSIVAFHLPIFMSVPVVNSSQNLICPIPQLFPCPSKANLDIKMYTLYDAINGGFIVNVVGKLATL